MVHPQLQEILSKLKAQMLKEYGKRLDRMLLFGSQARGEADPESDVDVMIVLNSEVDSCTEIFRTNEFVSDLCLEYTVMISCVFVSSADYQAKQNAYFYRNVHRDGLAV